MHGFIRQPSEERQVHSEQTAARSRLTPQIVERRSWARGPCCAAGLGTARFPFAPAGCISKRQRKPTAEHTVALPIDEPIDTPTNP